jgi:glucokinase
MTLSLGVDIGGTKIAAGVVDENGVILKFDRVKSPSDSRDAIKTSIIELCKSFISEFEIKTVGISAAGFLSKDRKQIHFSPHLDMTSFHLGEEVSQSINLPVILENDANCAAWGEFRFGAGKGYTNLVMVTIGTGLGTGIVIDSKLVTGGFGMAAEGGHLVLVPKGEPCGCGLRGCFEQYASGSALTRNARMQAIEKPDSMRAVLNLANGDTDQITGELVTLAAQHGDSTAITLLAEIGTKLGEGLALIAAILDPEIFVIGGGGSDAGELILASARTSYLPNLTAGQYRPAASIVRAELGNDAGIVGVADLARL